MMDNEAKDAAVKPRRGRVSAAELKRREKELEEREKVLMELEAEVYTAKPVEPAPEPARSRQSETRRQRRARGSNDLSHQMKLGVSIDLDPEYEYRWINGGLDDQRLNDKTRTDQQGADWQTISTEGETSDNVGAVIRRAVGVNQATQVEYAYLCRKPRDLYEEDHALIQERNDKRIRAIYRGRDPDSPDKDPAGLGYEQRTSLSGQGSKAIKI